MSTTYRKADDDIVELLATVMREHHPDLHEAGVWVGVVEAHNPDGDAVKHGGYPAFACVKIVSPRDRVSKGYDVEMLSGDRATAVVRAGSAGAAWRAARARSRGGTGVGRS